MQLNVHIPKDKEHLPAELSREAKDVGRPKNEPILEAIERQIAISEART
jgi:hypothetical protein